MSVSPWLAADIWNYGGSARLMKGFSIQPWPYTVSLFPRWLWVVCWPQWQSQERKYTLWYQYSLISGSLLISNYLIKGRWIICGPEFLQTGADLHGSDVQLSPQCCHWLALSCWIYFCRCDLRRKFCFQPSDEGRQSLSLPGRKWGCAAITMGADRLVQVKWVCLCPRWWWLEVNDFCYCQPATTVLFNYYNSSLPFLNMV